MSRFESVIIVGDGESAERVIEADDTENVTYVTGVESGPFRRVIVVTDETNARKVHFLSGGPT